jgi:hydroxymethylpyrimidine/phosphomethylpyrimidine kinase
VSRVVCIGGWDPSGRAGLLADAWAVERSRSRIAGVVTAITEQGARFRSTGLPPAQIRGQLLAVLDGAAVGAAKLGMVPDRASLQAICAALRRRVEWIVVDPVVRTSRAEPLSSLRPADYSGLAASLPGARAILTPNRDELDWLALSPAALLELGWHAVVVKGGESGVDVVHARDQRPVQLHGGHLRRSTLHHRGTGCRFGSGLAAALASGEALVPATRRAKRLVRNFLSTV